MVVVSREAEEVDPRVQAKTSCVFATRHEEGALAAAIASLASHHVNLTKLESRPQPGAPWEYRFYLDFEGNPAVDESVAAALRDFAEHTRYLRVLGTYAARTGEAGKPSSPKPKLGSNEQWRESQPPRVVPSVAPVRLAGRTLGEAPLLLTAVDEAAAVDEVAGIAVEFGAAGLLVLGQVGRPELETLAGLAHGRELPIGLPFVDSEGLAEALRSAELLVVPRERMGDERLLAEAARGGAPLILPRGEGQSDEAWFAAAEHCRGAGNGRVVLCEHGSPRPDFAAFAELTEKAPYPVLFVVDGEDGGFSTRIARLALAAGAAGIVAREPSRAALGELAALFYPGLQPSGERSSANSRRVVSDERSSERSGTSRRDRAAPAGSRGARSPSSTSSSSSSSRNSSSSSSTSSMDSTLELVVISAPLSTLVDSDASSSPMASPGSISAVRLPCGSSLGACGSGSGSGSGSRAARAALGGAMVAPSSSIS